MQSPSSLIFLVLLGVWAAYFVQYWIRRRDHLATARSVEQFTAAMRVLERRTPIPRTDLSDPAPRSWSVHPARASRPQVVVKRAVPAETPALGASRVLSESLERRSTAPQPVPGRPGAVPAARPVGPVRPSRRVRGSVLLLALLGTLVSLGLVGLALVPAWTPVVAVGVVGLALVWVRAGVRAEQALRAARHRRAVHEARRRATAAPTASTGMARRRVPAAAPAAAAHHTTDRHASDGRARTTSQEPAPAEGTSTSDPLEVALAEPETGAGSAGAETASAAHAEPAHPEPSRPQAEAEPSMSVPEPEPEPAVEYVHLVDEDDIPLTWDPVPVPRPTYTMKAKAERPEVPPADTTPEPAPAQTALRTRASELDERRAAGA